jgi:pyruvate kinase
MLPRKTKIVCTIGPATAGKENLRKLIDAGMNAARLNFSHGSYDAHLQNIRDIREVAKESGQVISIIQDLQGPKIRVCKFDGGFAELSDGGQFIITADNIPLGNKERVSTTYPDLVKDVKPGKTLLLDDGYIILEVVKVSGNDIITKVIKGGKLKDSKGIIAPGVSISASSLSEKDIQDLKFGLENGVDIVALSFVRSERDVIELRTTMKVFGRIVPIISKIERLEGYSDIDDIVEESDGIMVARGDLGLEMPAEEVPILQKEIIKKCNLMGKPVITATQMLESMISNPRPTRAEASDVANAVLDGTDCVMLSGETSVGQFPFEAVGYMDRIIRTAEEQSSFYRYNRFGRENNSGNMIEALGMAACVLADQINAAAIIATTKSGHTAKNVAKYKPRKPIIALTDSDATARSLSISWGVVPYIIPEGTSLLDILESPEEFISLHGKFNSGDKIVFVAGLDDTRVKKHNLIKVFII